MEDGQDCATIPWDDLEITSFDPSGNSLSTNDIDIVSDCELYLTENVSRTWVFSSAELGIQDTLDIKGVNYSLNLRDECPCGAVIDKASGTLNGVEVEGTCFTIGY